MKPSYDTLRFDEISEAKGRPADGVFYEGALRASVGSFSRGASTYGVMDLVGNAEEWVSDWFDAEYHKVSPRENPQGPAIGEQLSRLV